MNKRNSSFTKNKEEPPINKPTHRKNNSTLTVTKHTKIDTNFIEDRKKTLVHNLTLFSESTTDVALKDKIRRIKTLLKESVKLRKQKKEKRMEFLVESQILLENRHNSSNKIANHEKILQGYKEARNEKVNYIHDYVDKFCEVDQFVDEKLSEQKENSDLKAKIKDFKVKKFLFQSNEDQLLVSELKEDIRNLQRNCDSLRKENKIFRKERSGTSMFETQLDSKLKIIEEKRDYLKMILNKVEKKEEQTLNKIIDKERRFENLEVVEWMERTKETGVDKFYEPKEVTDLVATVLDFTVDERMLDLSVINKNWDVSAIKHN